MPDQIDVGREQALKAKVAGLRRKKSLPDEVWERARATPEFPAALAGDAEALGRVNVAVGFGYYLQGLAKRGKAAKERSQRGNEYISPEERKRSEVMSRHFARLARRLGEFTFADDKTGDLLCAPS